MAGDRFYRDVVQSALKGDVDKNVQMNFGELFLFHFLVQEFGLTVLDEEQFIHILERNKARLDSIDGPVQSQ